MVRQGQEGKQAKAEAKSGELFEVGEDDEEETTKSVNYGYHPIIDFFPMYRWSAAAARKK
jgi:hypothetical protein